MSMVRARLAIALAALAAGAALSACGGGDDGSASSGDAAATATATATAPASPATTEDESGDDSPESHIAPDAEVAAGLKRLKVVAATAAAGGGGNEARDAVETVWQPIEGTVKKNEPELYLDVEDSFELLSSGDSGDAKRGEQRLDQAIDAYLAKHPG